MDMISTMLMVDRRVTSRSMVWRTLTPKTPGPVSSRLADAVFAAWPDAVPACEADCCAVAKAARMALTARCWPSVSEPDTRV